MIDHCASVFKRTSELAGNTTLQPFHKGRFQVGGWVLTIQRAGSGKHIAGIDFYSVRDGREARILTIPIDTGDTNTKRQRASSCHRTSHILRGGGTKDIERGDGKSGDPQYTQVAPIVGGERGFTLEGKNDAGGIRNCSKGGSKLIRGGGK